MLRGEIQLIRHFDQQLASCCTRSEISMCLADALVRKWVLSMDVDSQGTTRNQSPEFGTVAVVFLESHQIVEDPNPRGVDVGESTGNK